MKITKVETFLVPPRWLFLRIETDDGVIGWGEPAVEGRAATVAAAVDEMSDFLIGADPMRIEDNWQLLTKAGFYRGGPVLSSAVAGIDQALWDIAGKTHGVPVHVLLGGPVRERVRIYSWIGGDRPADVGEQAAAQRELGLTAVKMNGAAELAHVDTPVQTAAIVARVSEVRDAVGNEVDIAIDFHGRFSLAMARRVLPMLEELEPMFVEEPLVPELRAELGPVAACTSVPIATGERLYSRWDYRDIIGCGIAVAQPDVSHAGGISESRRIAAMAETYGVAIAPHCPLGPIALAASLQVDFAAPNFYIQEQSLGIHYNAGADLLDYLVDTSAFSFNNGYLNRPTGPGLGIDVDEGAVRHAAKNPHRWRVPVWRHADGSHAEW